MNFAYRIFQYKETKVYPIVRMWLVSEKGWGEKSLRSQVLKDFSTAVN